MSFSIWLYFFGCPDDKTQKIQLPQEEPRFVRSRLACPKGIGAEHPPLWGDAPRGSRALRDRVYHKGAIPIA
ncbi:hypothetical protein [Mastigocladopsis repens]|uniref:hypothetical protein n=1 Tax=Mastigocladopsis repens TaxID=221287 RepID=UPI0002D76B7E|nr:hypothetical protein [Mastigocladopsis repens]